MRRSLHALGVGMVMLLLACFTIGGTHALLGQPPAPPSPRDPAAEIPGARKVAIERPEQRLNEHDRSDVFDPEKAPPSSPALDAQPEHGKMTGFDFGRDALGSKRPMQTFQEIMAIDVAARPVAMSTQKSLLARRYDLHPRLDPEAKMSRGKPLVVGPTARLPEGMDWEKLGAMETAEIRRQGVFPYPSLPHPKQMPGGMVFPPSQLAMFPRLTRFDVDHDLPEAFLPEFPPAMYLQNHPELGDVSRGQVVSLENFTALFKDILTPVQLDGLRLLLTPFPQEEFNATDDRKTTHPSPGVSCFDCHVNGHTSGQFELSPDFRPQQRRIRLDTPSIRGGYNQQLFGSKRSIRSLRDFAEFEQRTAYFNGDQTHAEKKGIMLNIEDLAARMERMQVMLDFPPAPKLNALGRLDSSLATESERRGEAIFHGKGQCAACHPAPIYMDNQMHDLHLERFLKDEPGDGPIKSFSLRGIKDSPPYLHDGRCLTLEDTVEFFNMIMQLRLNRQEKQDLVAFMRQL